MVTMEEGDVRLSGSDRVESDAGRPWLSGLGFRLSDLRVPAAAAGLENLTGK